MERTGYDLRFRWSVGLEIEDTVWDPTSFTKNCDRLLAGELAQQFLAAMLAQDKRLPLKEGVKRLPVEPKPLGECDVSNRPPHLSRLAIAT